MNRTNTLISSLTGFLVFLLAAAAFLLSFDALKHLAATNGIPTGKAWIYPAIVDGAIIVFSLSVLQASLNRQRTTYPWALVAVFTAMSVILNIVHAPNSFLSRVLAAIPPVALFLSFELLMGQIKGLVQRSGAIQSLQDLFETIRQRQAEIDNLSKQQTLTEKTIVERQQELDILTQKLKQQMAHFDKTVQEQQCHLDDIQNTIATSQAELKTLVTQRNRVRQEIDKLQGRKTARDKRDNSNPKTDDKDPALSLAETENELSHEELTERQETILSLLRDGKNPDDIANELGVSSRTVYRDIKSLNGLAASVTS